MKTNPPSMLTMTKKTLWSWKKEIAFSSSTLTDISNRNPILPKKLTAPTTTMSLNMTLKEPNPRNGLTLYQVSTTTMKISSPEKISTNSQNDDLGIMLLTSHQVLNQSIARLIPCRRKNKHISRSLLMKIFAPDKSSHHPHPWHHHSFLSKRKMESYAPLKIIES